MLAKLRELLAEHREFLYLLVAAGSFRIFAAVFLTVGGVFPHAHDVEYYHAFAELSIFGYYPFIDYWLEYPPVLAWLMVAVFKVSTLLPPYRNNFFWFQSLLGGFMALVDLGNLVLLYLIALRLHGKPLATRVGLLYATLFAPVYVLLTWADSLPLFTMLLATYLLLRNRPGLAGMAVGLGFMVKVFPAALAPVGLLALARWRARLGFAASAAVVALAIMAPFLLMAPQFLIAFFQAILSRGSWESLWAVLEGYYGIGQVAGIEDRFFPQSATWSNHEARLPWLLINAVFMASFAGLAGLKVPWRTPKGTVALAGLATLLTLFFSKGYSPQFLLYPLPFVLLLMPNGWGLGYALLLTALNLGQYPVYHSLFYGLPWVLVLLVAWRASVWVVLGLEFLALVSAGLARRWYAVRPFLIGLWLLMGVGGGLVALPGAVEHLGQLTPYGKAAEVVAERGDRRAAIVYSNPEAFYFAYPLLKDRAYLVVPDHWARQQDSVRDGLLGFARQHREVWVVLNYAQSEHGRVGFVEETLGQYGPAVFNEWFDTFRLVRFLSLDVAKEGAPMVEKGLRFGEAVVLEAHSALPDTVRESETLRLVTRWRLLAKPEQPLKSFVHLAGPDLRPLRQMDKGLPPGSPTSAGPAAAGQVFDDVVELTLGPEVPPGQYTLLLGVYEAANGRRLVPQPGANDYVELKRIAVTGR